MTCFFKINSACCSCRFLTPCVTGRRLQGFCWGSSPIRRVEIVSRISTWGGIIEPVPRLLLRVSLRDADAFWLCHRNITPSRLALSSRVTLATVDWNCDQLCVTGTPLFTVSESGAYWLKSPRAHLTLWKGFLFIFQLQRMKKNEANHVCWMRRKNKLSSRALNNLSSNFIYGCDHNGGFLFASEVFGGCTCSFLVCRWRIVRGGEERSHLWWLYQYLVWCTYIVLGGVDSVLCSLLFDFQALPLELL